MNVFDWSQTAADNDDSDPNINWQEGQAPSTVNNSGRAMMGAVARLVADQGGAVTTGGSSNAYTFDSVSDLDTYVDGTMLYMVANHTNTGAATLNVESLGTKKIRKVTAAGEVALDANDIMQNGHYLVGYDASADAAAGAFILHSPSTVALADGSITAAKLATDSVGSDEIQAGAVGASEIATDAVGSDEIAADAVGSSEIATGAVTTVEILNATIDLDDLSAEVTTAFTDDDASAAEIWAGVSTKPISVAGWVASLAEQTLTFNATYQPNGANGINFRTTGVSSNFTFKNMTNPVIGVTYAFRITHSAGSNVVTFESDYEGISKTLPLVSTTSGYTDVIYVKYQAAGSAVVWIARDIA